MTSAPQIGHTFLNNYPEYQNLEGDDEIRNVYKYVIISSKCDLLCHDVSLLSINSKIIVELE